MPAYIWTSLTLIAVVGVNTIVGVWIRRTGRAALPVYVLAYLSGIVIALIQEYYREGVALTVGSVLIGVIFAGPLSVYFWHITVKRWEGTLMTMSEGSDTPRRQPVSYWVMVVGSTALFSIGGIAVTLLFSAFDTDLNVGLLIAISIGVGLFNALAWIILRFVNPESIERMGFRKPK